MTPELRNDTEPLLTLGPWVVKNMTLTREKVAMLWQMVQPFRTVFSDLTRGDAENFVHAITHPASLWFEVWEDQMLVGIAWMTDINLVTDSSAHLLFFDRHPAEKRDVCMALIKWVFRNYPLHRISAHVPHMYHATLRLVQAMGFVPEGVKREAVLIRGSWVDIHMFGLTRSEVEAIP